MKLFPRHRKILEAIARGRGRAVCPNVLWQASGVIKYERPCAELRRVGLIRWVPESNAWKAGWWPAGWVLTKQGRARVGEPRRAPSR